MERKLLKTYERYCVNKYYYIINRMVLLNPPITLGVTITAHFVTAGYFKTMVEILMANLS